MIELLTVVLGPLFFMPIMTGYYAYNHGRSFWRWFLIGCGLPFFSLLVVAGVVHRDQRRQQRAAVLAAVAEVAPAALPPADPVSIFQP